MSHSRTLCAALAVLSLTGAALRSEAALNAVDTGPYQAANGFFPAWYQDSNGLGLDLCLSTAVSPNVPPPLPGKPPALMCLLVKNPGIYDPAFPTCFPGQCAGVTLPAGQTYNFPNEAFYAAATTTFNNGAIDLNYVAALEATFGTGVPTVGDQLTFARIRIRITLPSTAPLGTYTIIHPYGVETANVITTGVKAINLTRDIGLAQNVFTGALRGDLGPFLMDANVAANGLIEVNGEFFIGDPNTSQRVVGSPYNSNYVRVEGPAGFTAQQVDTFAVSGKVHTGALPTPLLIERSSYGRDATGTAQQDIFVKAPPAPTTNTPGYAVSAVPANGVDTPMTDNDSNAVWFLQSPDDPTAVSNPTVSVTAQPAAGSGLSNAATTSSSPVVDVVAISKAEATCLPLPATSCDLTVEASSSDQIALPTLNVNGQPLTPVASGPLQRVTLTGLTIPPATVTVTSSMGGSDSEPVTVLPPPEVIVP